MVHLDAIYWGRNDGVLAALRVQDTDVPVPHEADSQVSLYRRLKSAVRSIDFYLPYLFTCQEEGCEGMPNTNNKLEGTFTDLKKSLNNHSGMNGENRKRFICGFFLALE